MSQNDDPDRMADLCILACEAVLQHGTADMKLAARALLIALARTLVDGPPGAEGTDIRARDD